MNGSKSVLDFHAKYMNKHTIQVKSNGGYIRLPINILKVSSNCTLRSIRDTSRLKNLRNYESFKYMKMKYFHEQFENTLYCISINTNRGVNLRKLPLLRLHHEIELTIKTPNTGL